MDGGTGRVNELHLEIDTPEGFSFAATVLSHGWRNLAPFEYDRESGALSRTERLPAGALALVRMSVSKRGAVAVTAKATRRLDETDAAFIRRAVSRCLSLDRELAGFYGAIAEEPRYKWVVDHRAGRLLASSSVWEDLVKTLTTTNTSWSNTMSMCQRLAKIGPQIDDRHCFPTPSEIRAIGVDELGEATGLGYRTPYLHELASAVDDGEVEPERWREASADAGDIEQQILALKGFGPYAAANMLKLLGHYERLAIDSSVRETFRVQLNGGVSPGDADIERHYEPYGRWRGLVMWFDVMKTHMLANLEQAAPPG